MAKIGVEDLSHNIFDHLGQKSQNIQFTLHGGRPSVQCIIQNKFMCQPSLYLSKLLKTDFNITTL